MIRCQNIRKIKKTLKSPNSGCWLVFSIFSSPVSFYRGLTSLCHCHPRQVVPCIIIKKESFCFRFTVVVLLHGDKSSCAASSSHLDTIDLSAELARSHGFFAPSRGAEQGSHRANSGRLLTCQRSRFSDRHKQDLFDVLITAIAATTTTIIIVIIISLLSGVALVFASITFQPDFSTIDFLHFPKLRYHYTSAVVEEVLVLYLS